MMNTPSYDELYQRACERKGGEAEVEALLPSSATEQYLKTLGSDRYLAEFTRKVFQSGFVWRIVNNKWANFEEVFWNFDIERLLMMPEDMLERKASDPGIIRNYSKVKTVLQNAVSRTQSDGRTASLASSSLAGPKTTLLASGSISKNTGADSAATLGPMRFVPWVSTPS